MDAITVTQCATQALNYGMRDHSLSLYAVDLHEGPFIISVDLVAPKLCHLIPLAIAMHHHLRGLFCIVLHTSLLFLQRSRPPVVSQSHEHASPHQLTRWRCKREAREGVHRRSRQERNDSVERSSVRMTSNVCC